MSKMSKSFMNSWLQDSLAKNFFSFGEELSIKVVISTDKMKLSLARKIYYFRSFRENFNHKFLYG